MQHLSHLQYNRILLLRVHKLEVLHGRHGDASVEVQNVRSHLLVPAGRLVDQVDQISEIAVPHPTEHVIA